MRTARVNVDQARKHLADLIAFVSNGGAVIIEQDGKPLARLIAATDPADDKSLVSSPVEFSRDEDSLAWEADGWAEIA